MVGNVQILSSEGQRFQVAANFITFRTKSGNTDTYQGHYLYEMSLDEAGNIRIDSKTCYLDFANLYVQGQGQHHPVIPARAHAPATSAKSGS